MRVAEGTGTNRGTEMKMIAFTNREYLPATSTSQTMRLTLTPDGKSITYSTLKSTANLWLMDGLASFTPR